MNQQSLHPTMASVLLIDQKTFNKTEADVTVLSAVKTECLGEQLLLWDPVCGSVVKDNMNFVLICHFRN